MSGPKKEMPRASAAIRLPSRQTTARLIAGALPRAAIARARSERTSPSAPSATLARVSALSVDSSSAGDFVEDLGIRLWASGLDVTAHVEITQLAKQRRIEILRRLVFAHHPGIEITVRHIEQLFVFVEVVIG